MGGNVGPENEGLASLLYLSHRNQDKSKDYSKGNLKERTLSYTIIKLFVLSKCFNIVNGLSPLRQLLDIRC